MVEEDFDEFINNVFCRRDSNQHKAQKLWEKIKHKFPDDVQWFFKREWDHFVMGEFSVYDFARCDIKKLKEYIGL